MRANRGRTSSRNNPAAAAQRRGRAFRDLRASDAQVTAEQLIAQAQELRAMTGQTTAQPAKLLLMSATELALYRQKTRSDFEFQVKRSFQDFGTWLRYAQWEEQQDDMPRVRDVFERAIAHHGEKKELWRHYIESESRLGTPECARAVCNRAVTALPQCMELWLKFLALEQAAYRDDAVRQLFRRWIQTRPGPVAWRLAVIFECSRGELEFARDCLRDLVVNHNTTTSWLFYASVEQRIMEDKKRTAAVLETAKRALPDPFVDWRLHTQCAEAQARNGATDQARLTIESALQKASFDGDQTAQDLLFDALGKVYRQWSPAPLAIADGEASTLSQRDNTGLLTVVSRETDALVQSQAELKYQSVIHAAAAKRAVATTVTPSGTGNSAASTPATHTMSTVFDAYASLARLVQEREAQQSRQASKAAETSGSATIALLRECCTKRAPQTDTERQQHAALVLLLVDRLAAQEVDGGTSEALEEAHSLLQLELQSFPHARMHCPGLWVAAARTAIRRAMLSSSTPEGRVEGISVGRRIMGAAVAQCPCAEVFRAYLHLEQREIQAHDAADRSRRIFQAWLDRFPRSLDAWLAYASYEFEQSDAARCDGVLQMAIRYFRGVVTETPLTEMGKRYALLACEDTLWQDRLRFAMRVLQRGGGAGGAKSNESVESRLAVVRAIFGELLRAVTEDFVAEFDTWRTSLEASQAPRPAVLPKVLEGATRRLTAALQGWIGFELRQRPGADSAALLTSNAQRVRELIFKPLVQSRRSSVVVDADTSFAAATEKRQWVELSLQPVFYQWRQFEAAHGSAETLQQVADTAEPPKKKVRLFKS